MHSSETQQELIDMLWHAVEAGDCALIRNLVARGVDVNVRNKDGWTPLHVATQYGHVDAMRTLISARSMQRMAHSGMVSQNTPLTWNETLKRPSFNFSDTDAA